MTQGRTLTVRGHPACSGWSSGQLKGWDLNASRAGFGRVSVRQHRRVLGRRLGGPGKDNDSTHGPLAKFLNLATRHHRPLDGTQPKTTKRVKLSKNTYELRVGDSASLQPRVKHQNVQAGARVIAPRAGHPEPAASQISTLTRRHAPEPIPLHHVPLVKVGTSDEALAAYEMG